MNKIFIPIEYGRFKDIPSSDKYQFVEKIEDADYILTSISNTIQSSYKKPVFGLIFNKLDICNSKCKKIYNGYDKWGIYRFYENEFPFFYEFKEDSKNIEILRQDNSIIGIQQGNCAIFSILLSEFFRSTAPIIVTKFIESLFDITDFNVITNKFEDLIERFTPGEGDRSKSKRVNLYHRIIQYFWTWTVENQVQFEEKLENLSDLIENENNIIEDLIEFGILKREEGLISLPSDGIDILKKLGDRVPWLKKVMED